MQTQTDQSSTPYVGPDSGAGEGAQSKAGEAAGQAQEKAQQAAGQAQEKAQQAAGQVQDRVKEQIDQRSSQAAEQINEQASDLRSVSEALREQGKDGPAKAADRLAEYAEKVGGYLGDRNADTLLSDLEDFGRRQPWAVTAGGLALGFVASRFLKASSVQRYQTRPAQQQTRANLPAPASGRPAPAQSAAARSGNGLSGPPLPGTITPGAAPGV